MDDKSDVIARICDAVSKGATEEAAEIARVEYPFEPIRRASYSFSKLRTTEICAHDGFVDRYSGRRLVFPGALYVLPKILPDVFPVHPNWKMSQTHIVFWELFPSIDHVVPLARGGTNATDNLVCTSMMRNSAKANWTIEELGWKVLPAGRLEDWDGLTRWFLEFAADRPTLLASASLKGWHDAARRVFGPARRQPSRHAGP